MPLSGRQERHKFTDSGGALLDVREHPTEVIERVVHSLAQRDSGLKLRLKGMLHVAKHVASTGQNERHGAQLTEDLVPFPHAGPLLGDWDAGEDLGQPLCSVRRQMHRHADGVDDPAEHHLERAPRAVALSQLLERHGLAAVRIVIGAERADDAVDSVQQDSPRPPPACPSLAETQEVVNKHINVLERPASPWQAGRLTSADSRATIYRTLRTSIPDAGALVPG